MFNRKTPHQRLMDLLTQGRYEKLLKETEKMLPREESPNVMHSMRIHAFLELGRYKDAVAECHAAAKSDTLAPMRWHHKAGDIYGEREMYWEAINEFETCAHMNPDNPVYPTNVATMRALQGDHAAAMEQVDRVLTRWPTYTYALCTKARFLARRGDNNMALEFLEVAAQIEPGNKTVVTMQHEIRTALLVRQSKDAEKLS